MAGSLQIYASFLAALMAGCFKPDRGSHGQFCLLKNDEAADAAAVAPCYRLFYVPGQACMHAHVVATSALPKKETSSA